MVGEDVLMAELQEGAGGALGRESVGGGNASTVTLGRGLGSLTREDVKSILSVPITACNPYTSI